MKIIFGIPAASWVKLEISCLGGHLIKLDGMGHDHPAPTNSITGFSGVMEELDTENPV